MELAFPQRTIKGLRVAIIVPTILGYLAVLLKIFYALPLIDSFIWYFGVFLYFYVPGNLLLRFLNSNCGEYIGNFFHSLALGTAMLPLMYVALRRLQSPWFLHIPVVIMFLIWVVQRARDFKSPREPANTSYGEILAFAVLLAFVVSLLHLTYFTDIIFLKDGLKMRNIYLTETDFHLGIVNMLKDTFPPLFPYASGKTLSYYHMNMHLEIEMFHRFLSLDTLKLVFFYFPLLYFCLLVYMPYLFIRMCSGTRPLAVLSGLLMFGADLSFIPGLLGVIPPDYPWAHLLPYPWTLFFRTTLWPILCLNGFLPAMFTLSLCMVHLKQYLNSGKITQAIIFGILGFAAFGFKSTMGIQIVLSTSIAGIAGIWYAKGDSRGKIICLVSVIAALLMVSDVVLVRGGTGNTVVSLDLLNNFRHSLQNLHIKNLPGPVYPLLIVLYVVMSFGVRIPGFFLMRIMAIKKHFDPVALSLIVFSLSGFIASEMLYLGNEFFFENNAMWFAVQSLTGAWLLLSYYLVKFSRGRVRILIMAMVILMAFPSTVQFLTLRYDSSYYECDARALEVARYLEKTPPGSVVLHPIVGNGPSLAAHFAGRPSVISVLHTHVSDMLGEEEKARRLADVSLFFSSVDNIDRATIVRKYHAAYVYAPVEYGIFLDKEPFMVPVMSNGAYIIYQVKTA